MGVCVCLLGQLQTAWHLYFKIWIEEKIENEAVIAGFFLWVLQKNTNLGELYDRGTTVEGKSEHHREKYNNIHIDAVENSLY